MKKINNTKFYKTKIIVKDIIGGINVIVYVPSLGHGVTAVVDMMEFPKMSRGLICKGYEFSASVSIDSPVTVKDVK